MRLTTAFTRTRARAARAGNSQRWRAEKPTAYTSETAPESSEMNMPGIEFLIDRNGRKKAVLIDLKKHKGLWEDLFDAISRTKGAANPVIHWPR